MIPGHFGAALDEVQAINATIPGLYPSTGKPGVKCHSYLPILLMWAPYCAAPKL